MRVALALLLFTIGCAHAGTRPRSTIQDEAETTLPERIFEPARWDERVPRTLLNAVALEWHGRVVCWAVPLAGGTLAATAGHCVEGQENVRWRDRSGRRGTMKVLSRSPENDVAVVQAVSGAALERLSLAAGRVVLDLSASPIFEETFEVAEAIPDPQEEVYFLVVLPGRNGDTVAPMSGRVIAVDSDGDLAIDGAVQAGSSGGPLVNARGQLVGIVKYAWNPAKGMIPSYGRSVDGRLRGLADALNFRSFLYATPIRKQQEN